MSFSKQVKEELNSIQIKNNCCKKAFLFGALISAANAEDQKIKAQFSDVDTAEKIVFILDSIYRCDVNVKKIKNIELIK